MKDDMIEELKEVKSNKYCSLGNLMIDISPASHDLKKALQKDFTTKLLGNLFKESKCKKCQLDIRRDETYYSCECGCQEHYHRECVKCNYVIFQSHKHE